MTIEIVPRDLEVTAYFSPAHKTAGAADPPIIFTSMVL